MSSFFLCFLFLFFSARLVLFVCRGWGPTTLDEDTVYDVEWSPLGKKRKLSDLMQHQDRERGFYFWHDMVHPRKGPQKFERKRKKKKPRKG